MTNYFTAHLVQQFDIYLINWRRRWTKVKLAYKRNRAYRRSVVFTTSYDDLEVTSLRRVLRHSVHEIFMLTNDKKQRLCPYFVVHFSYHYKPSVSSLHQGH